MNLQDAFAKDIDRPINGVIKADQSDQAYNELDEYVITKEVDRHLRAFVAAYLSALDRGASADAAAKMGVWVSGFFGSGKSHLIKILSYLLANEAVAEAGKAEKKPLDFFLEKMAGDAAFQGDLRRMAGAETEVILFNIDSKAEQNHQRDSVLRVFLRVFNELCGYSGDHPEVAHMERFLDEKGRYQAFKDALLEDHGLDWVKERDSYHFHAAEVAEALSKVLGQKVEQVQPWIEDLEKRLSLTVESFARWVKEYLDGRGNDARLVFLVDEVGQFIGGQSQLMLNLQTITENLGTACKGRAWVVVTSQEDMDAVVGSAFEKAREMDFSKIQGRFKTRLSLSGSNADEVIQRRLLAKTDDATAELKALFAAKGDILKNQITFRDARMTLKAFADANDFAVCYPFPPYQFTLVQKIFEASRKFGASGGHLSQGERSMLDAFQTAVRAIEDQPLGALITLDAFYPAIESFLEGVVRVAINRTQAIVDGSPMDQRVLKTLFLVRYVEEVPGNIDNLVTFFVNEVDADKRAIREEIEQSLLCLEAETLISRNGDLYFFLTNEERDINKEIKSQEYGPGDRQRLLGEVIFEDVLRDLRKYRYPANGKDFDLARLVDLAPIGARVDSALTVSVLTPMAEDYRDFNAARCLQQSMEGAVGQVLIKLPDEGKLADEIVALIKTEAYLRLKSTAGLPPTTQRIFDDKREENRQRRERIRATVAQMMESADFYIRGSQQTFSGGPKAAVDAALQYLVENGYNKLALIQQSPADPMAEIRAVLADRNSQELDLIGGSHNGRALKEVLDYVDLLAGRSQSVNLGSLINERFARHPYGWREQDTLLLVCRLFTAGEIELHASGGKLQASDVYGNIDGSNKWNRVTLSRRQTVDRGALLAVRNLARDLFGATAPDTEEALAEHLRREFTRRLSSLDSWAQLAAGGDYPGKSDIAELQGVIRKAMAQRDSFSLITHLRSETAALAAQGEMFHRLDTFYERQRPQWEQLRRAWRERFEPNDFHLRKEPHAAAALATVISILRDPEPYGRIREAGVLIDTLTAANDKVVADRRAEAVAVVDPRIQSVKDDLSEIGVDADFSNTCLRPLQDIRRRIETETRTGQIAELVREAEEAEDEANSLIEQAVAAAKAKVTEPRAGGVKEASAGAFKGPPAVSKPEKFRQRRQVDARGLMGGKPYLETRADVDAYLDALREQLEEALAQNARIEIL